MTPTTTIHTELRVKQREEALKRMKTLRLLPNVVKEFADEGRVYLSERQNQIYDGILYWADQYPVVKAEIAKLEATYEALVYHAQLSHTHFGDMLTLLYVSRNKGEWADDLRDLTRNEACAYVANLTDPDMSEFGFVGIEPRNGGVTRTY